ncbi:MAG: HDOD domain-containing protein [Nitrosomonadales bacterium]|nr:MAG: HDOD domain-containing protein [Nitrosomonadales bacterium]
MADQPQDLQGWVAFLCQAEIPVLKHTARDLARLQEDEDKLSARAIASVVIMDPMMTARLLRYLQEHKRKSQVHELVQIESALMMLGLTTFFNAVPARPQVEEVLQPHLAALTHLLRLVHRAHRAARYAFDWALLLHDLHAEEVRVAALLHDLADMLMWCYAPQDMLKIQRMQEQDKALRSHTVQEQVFGFKLADLQVALAQEWQLPDLLLKLMDSAYAQHARVSNVLFAANLARHSSHGWDDAALPDDYKDIGGLLRMEPEKVMLMVGAVEPEANQPSG